MSHFSFVRYQVPLMLGIERLQPHCRSLKQREVRGIVVSDVSCHMNHRGLSCLLTHLPWIIVPESIFWAGIKQSETNLVPMISNHVILNLFLRIEWFLNQVLYALSAIVRRVAIRGIVGPVMTDSKGIDHVSSNMGSILCPHYNNTLPHSKYRYNPRIGVAIISIWQSPVVSQRFLAQ